MLFIKQQTNSFNKILGNKNRRGDLCRNVG